MVIWNGSESSMGFDFQHHSLVLSHKFACPVCWVCHELWYRRYSRPSSWLVDVWSNGNLKASCLEHCFATIITTVICSSVVLCRSHSVYTSTCSVSRVDCHSGSVRFCIVPGHGLLLWFHGLSASFSSPPSPRPPSERPAEGGWRDSNSVRPGHRRLCRTNQGGGQPSWRLSGKCRLLN